jgi:2-oxoglutarate dehydrogenase E2 component (dihydrolipoamide succinyltransferase)
MSNIVVPQLGESVVEARVAKWLKKVGDRVTTGEPVVELETDKIDLEVGADHAGVLSTISRAEGEDVKVGDVLAVVEDGAAAAQESQASPARQAPEAPAPEAPAPEAPAPPAPAPQSPQEPRATPTARRIAREHDVDIRGVQGSGSSGRVLKQDVQTALKPGAAPQLPGERTEERVRMSKRRQTIARRLVEAQRTAAMLTTFNDVDMSAVMALRQRRKEDFKKEHGVSLGIASFFVNASIAALKAYPLLNAEIQGDEILYKRYYDIGIAVGAEGGLVVPVLRDADRMSFADIELGIRDFAGRAADGTLTLDDLTGGTFTITNGGVFGSLMSTPILNPPQVGILGLHKIQDRAVPVDGQVVIRPMMYVALSYDHRLVDGREAVQFLVKIKELVEDPANLLLVS